MCPALVSAGHIHPSRGFPAEFQRLSSTMRTRGPNGSTRRAAFVLPSSIKSAPFRPPLQLMFSHLRQWHSSGRIPVSNKTEFANAGYSKIIQVLIPGVAFGLAHAGYLNQGL